ncbi:MAG: hypothetical protein JWN56_1836 [Sphingobacteriales bacterium]|nr:hypothetical protein [Sphingobacteriales bacterium]
MLAHASGGHLIGFILGDQQENSHFFNHTAIEKCKLYTWETGESKEMAQRFDVITKSMGA